MKILHLCLSCFYIDRFGYQENLLVAEHVRAGHDVHVLASTETFDANGKLTYVAPASYMGADGAMVERLPYRYAAVHPLARKVRAYVGLAARLRALAPDVIVFHGLSAYALLTVARHVRRHPHTILHADSHEDFNNSARGPVSKWLLHYGFYRTLFHLALPAIRTVSCISKETESFVLDFYGCPPEKVRYLPLGGNVLTDTEYVSRRAAARARYGWTGDHRVFVQSGKFDAPKRLLESLEAFCALPDPNVRLVLAGVFLPEIRARAEALVRADARIRHVGWLDRESLTDLLVGADVYLQPGSQSATMQMALCCRRPVIVADVVSHRPLVSTNGWLVGSNESLREALQSAARIEEPELASMSAQSARIAEDLLDYSRQAATLT